jgi:amino acid adenylation domain-containing protein
MMAANPLPRTAAPRTPLVPELVAAQAATTPDAVALGAEGAVTCYRDIDRRANQLAHHLQGLGVGPDVLVGLCVGRSAAMVIGALGIMRAGGAYVPLDPGYPANRLDFMLRDTNAPVLVTQERLLARVPLGECRAVIVDERAAALAEAPSGPVDCQATASNLAYVLYTSGSTGQPKGVEITHGGLLNLVFWHRRAFTVTAADRATQLASIAFDAAVWELWPYLTAGASVHIPDDVTRVTPRLLRDWLVAERITLSFLPTPLAEAVITLDWPPDTALRTLLTGADTLHRYPPPSLPFALVNNYGPTEATVVTTSGVVPSDAGSEAVPSIGRPIEGARVHIVDGDLRAVAAGEIGELLIGGAGVARGYLNRPALTEERFVHDRFSDQSDARLYRTGDLVRSRPDGELEFLGRTDDQVKIRGHRVELGEIATTLNRCPAVRSGLVVVVEQSPGEKRLVAYVVPADDSQRDSEPLRSHLAARLPDYMVPADFVWLPELPMTPNGKVDLAALPASRPPGSPQPSGDATASNELEQTLVSIVGELLGLETVGTDENFFTLGGHSLLGAQLIARIGDLFGVQMPLRDLFDNPTVAAMTLKVERLLIAELDAMSDEEAERLAGVGPGRT